MRCASLIPFAVDATQEATGSTLGVLGLGEELVRVPPKLMAPERRAGRARGKSDPIDALAVARAWERGGA